MVKKVLVYDNRVNALYLYTVSVSETNDFVQSNHEILYLSSNIDSGWHRGGRHLHTEGSLRKTFDGRVLDVWHEDRP